MGTALTALVKASGEPRAYDRFVDALVGRGLPAVARLPAAREDAGGMIAKGEARWRMANAPSVNGIMQDVAIPRPKLPNYEAWFVSPEELYFVFGDDAILVNDWAPYDWFLTQKQWAHAVVDAVKQVMGFVGSTKAIITSDNEVVAFRSGPFFAGASFDECIAALENNGCHRVFSREEMYHEKDGLWSTSGYLVIEV